MKCNRLLVALCLGIGLAISATAQDSTKPASDSLGECYKQIGDQSRRALEGCLNGLLSKAQQAMQKTYDRAEEQLKQTGSAGVPAALASLRASQKAFESFRDAECRRVGDAALGGSGSGDFEQSCEVDLTRWRTEQLNSDL